MMTKMYWFDIVFEFDDVEGCGIENNDFIISTIVNTIKEAGTDYFISKMGSGNIKELSEYINQSIKQAIEVEGIYKDSQSKRDRFIGFLDEITSDEEMKAFVDSLVNGSIPNDDLSKILPFSVYNIIAPPRFWFCIGVITQDILKSNGIDLDEFDREYEMLRKLSINPLDTTLSC